MGSRCLARATIITANWSIINVRPFERYSRARSRCPNVRSPSISSREAAHLVEVEESRRLRVAVHDVVVDRSSRGRLRVSRRYPRARLAAYTSPTRDSRTKARAVGESGVSRKLSRDRGGGWSWRSACCRWSKDNEWKISPIIIEEIMVNQLHVMFLFFLFFLFFCLTFGEPGGVRHTPARFKFL